jgi:Uma2 family endonuclease
MRPVNVEEEKKYSVDEYIKIDEFGTVRHEYYNGKLIPMPGESLLHNHICLLLYRLLFQSLPPHLYRIFVENVKVSIEGDEKYVYPDITVTKKQLEKVLPYKDYIIYEPILIAEVLSDSTRKYDLTDKFILYQKISTLQYYLALEQEKQVVLFYEKNEQNEWFAKTFTSLNEVIELKGLSASISLKDIYSDK